VFLLPPKMADEVEGAETSQLSIYVAIKAKIPIL
jgi:hypothetical protein